MKTNRRKRSGRSPRLLGLRNSSGFVVTFRRKNGPQTYYSDAVMFTVNAKDAETAINHAEQKFEELCGTESRPAWIISRVELT